MANLKSESKNPIFLCLIILVAGAGLLIWGAIKGDCSGPNCWVGSGFLKWAGGILIAAGIGGMFLFGGGKGKR